MLKGVVYSPHPQPRYFEYLGKSPGSAHSNVLGFHISCLFIHGSMNSLYAFKYAHTHTCACAHTHMHIPVNTACQLLSIVHQWWLDQSYLQTITTTRREARSIGPPMRGTYRACPEMGDTEHAQKWGPRSIPRYIRRKEQKIKCHTILS